MIFYDTFYILGKGFQKKRKNANLKKIYNLK